MARTYRHSWGAMVLSGAPVLLVLGAWITALGLGLFGETVYAVVDGQHVTLGRVLGGFAAVGVGVAFVLLLRLLLTTPFMVRVSDDGWCEFRSIVRRTRLEASSIAWVRPKRDSEIGKIIGMSVGYRVAYEDKRLSLELPSRRLAGFVQHLQQLNPRIPIDRELRGLTGSASDPLGV